MGGKPVFLTACSIALFHWRTTPSSAARHVLNKQIRVKILTADLVSTPFFLPLINGEVSNQGKYF
jgi:hypothetical protein